MPTHAPASRAPHAAVGIVLVLLALAAALVVSAPPASAADDHVTWTVRTASNDYGSNRTAFDYTIDPGGSVRDALVVANHGDEPLSLSVYAADGYTTDDGQLDVLTAGTESEAVGTWLQTDAATVTVQPGAAAELPFTLTVPDTATPGDHAGAVITSLTQPDNAAGITVDRRLGIRVGLRVAGELAPALTIDDVRTTFHGTTDPLGTGDATVTYTLHNTGNTVISAQQGVQITGPFGWFAVDTTDMPASPDLLPGESWQASVPIQAVVPAGRIRAVVTALPTVTDPAGSTSTLDPVEAAAGTWAVPWTALAAILVLVALATVAIRRRRGRAAREETRERVAAALRERGEADATAGEVDMGSADDDPADAAHLTAASWQSGRARTGTDTRS